jgi:hypothetical protein
MNGERKNRNTIDESTTTVNFSESSIIDDEPRLRKFSLCFLKFLFIHLPPLHAFYRIERAGIEILPHKLKVNKCDAVNTCFIYHSPQSSFLPLLFVTQHNSVKAAARKMRGG